MVGNPNHAAHAGTRGANSVVNCLPPAEARLLEPEAEFESCGIDNLHIPLVLHRLVIPITLNSSSERISH